MTTAQLRALAYDAQTDARYKEAARLYREALAAYPTIPGALATQDKANLETFAIQCELAS